MNNSWLISIHKRYAIEKNEENVNAETNKTIWKHPFSYLAAVRFGSTLVQCAIKAHPEVTMFNEHEGFLALVDRLSYD